MSYRKFLRCLQAAFLVFAGALIYQSGSTAAAERLDGREVFGKRCTGCHATDANKEGPRLRGVLGRKAGSVAGFQYSDALRSSGITWTEDLVNKWLENPDGLVKDNDMEFHVANPDERAAVVTYLKSLSN